jgi:hypothetical protein
MLEAGQMTQKSLDACRFSLLQFLLSDNRSVGSRAGS